MSDATPSLESKVAFLSQPTSYAGKVHRVEAIETHMSWVFMAGAYAYKLKKPVHHDFLDFSSLAARRYYCGEELCLNRRLAPAVYLEVVALTLDKAERLHLAGSGTAVDWLVKMHRLPPWRMFDYAIKHHIASARDVRRIAARLAAFHQTLQPEPIAPLAYRTGFSRQIELHHAELGEAAYRMPAARIDALCQAQARALSRVAGLLEARASEGHIVEGHGDLRPEHVCLLPDIAIIDCLEFARALRVLDQADEVGYLALECERLHAPEIAAALLQEYGLLSGDHPAPLLTHFYQSCRASKRALITIRHVKEEKFRHSPHWRRSALTYLALAARHVAHCQ